MGEESFEAMLTGGHPNSLGRTMEVALTGGSDGRDWLMVEPIFESSGNIFEDLDLEPAEAAILQMRAKLMNDLREYVQSSGMTQTEAAQVLGVTQSRVSDLMRGKWDKFSLEMLITLEARAGRQVTLELAP